jgi:hypothetical protein
MNETKTIFRVNETYTWLREPLLMRLPDGSLFCEVFLGGSYDGCKDNILSGIRSDDDGETWSGLETVKAIEGVGCWAGSVFAYGGTGYIFWLTLDHDRSEMTNHLLSTGADGRSFVHDRLMGKYPDTRNGSVDIRRGTVLRDGRVLFPASWHETLDPSLSDDDIKISPERRKRLANVGGARILNKISACGVVEPNADFTEFKKYGRVCHLTPDGEIPSVPLFENQIAELSDGSLSMLIRGDLSNRLWRSDSRDGGYTWSEPVMTDIPNPGSKPLILNLPDGRIVLFNNPREKDYDDVQSHHHAYRTPLEMWISDDDMQTWSTRETIAPATDVAQYPDGFFDPSTDCIYLVWENDKEVFFRTIAV